MNIVNQNKCLICESKNIKDSIKLKDHSHTGECFSVVQCCECGFNFTQDAPDEESIGPYYKGENYISHSDTQKGFFFNGIRGSPCVPDKGSLFVPNRGFLFRVRGSSVWSKGGSSE